MCTQYKQHVNIALKEIIKFDINFFRVQLHYMFILLQAYLVFKYNGKEQPATTVSRGSKYVAAPKSSNMLSTQSSTAGAVNVTTFTEKTCADCEFNSPLEKDIQVC